MFRPLMAQPSMGRVGRGRIADRSRSIHATVYWILHGWLFWARFAAVELQVVTSWNSMLELIWVVLLGPPETNRRKPFCFYGRLPVAQLICCELYL